MPINPLNIPYPDFKIHEVIDPEQFDLNNERIVDKVNEVITEHESTKGNFQTQIDTNESESIARDNSLDAKIITKETEAIARNTTTNNLIATRASESITRDNNLQSQITANVTQLAQQRLNWLPFVNTIALRDAIPNPKNADAVFVRDTNRLYRHNGSAWIAIQDASMTVVNEVDLRLSARLDKIELDVTYFGAVGDGVTDDSEAIQAAIAYLPTVGGTLRFPEGKTFLLGDGIMDPVNGTGTDYPEDIAAGDKRPDVDTDPEIGRDIRLYFDGFKDITIIGYGATIRSHPNNGETKRNSIFTFKNCYGVKILGLTVDGNKNARQPKLSDYSNAGGWNSRSNIAFSDTNNVIIKDVTSINSMMDGIAFGGSTGVPIEGVYISNTICDNAYRNGLTLSTTRYVRVENSRFTDTGKTYGTAPKIGADIEADYGGTSNENVVFADCYFSGNVIAGLAFASGSVNNHVIRCTFDGPNQYPTFGFNSAVWGYNYVNHCHYIDCGISTEARGVYIENNSFEFNPVVASGGTGSVSVMHLQGPDVDSDAYVYIKNNTFIMNLDNVSPSATSLDLGRFWVDSRTNVVIQNNTFINFFCTSSGFYLFRPGSGNITFKDNIFRFDPVTHASLLPLFSANNFFLGTDGYVPKLNLFKGNEFIGYPEILISIVNQGKYSSINDGVTYQKSVVLTGNSVTKINPEFVGGYISFDSYQLTIEAFYGPMKAVYEINESWDPGHELVIYKGSKLTSDYSELNVDFYRDGNNFYVQLTGVYTVVRATLVFTANQNVTTIDETKNIFAPATTADISGLTAIQPICKVPMVANTAALAGLNFPVGHSVFIYNLNKPLWWDDTNWVDSAGTVVV